MHYAIINLRKRKKGAKRMFNKKAFQIAVIAAGMTYEDVARAIGINVSTLYRKSTGKSEFTRNEIQKLCEVLNLESPMDIFFDKQLT